MAKVCRVVVVEREVWSAIRGAETCQPLFGQLALLPSHCSTLVGMGITCCCSSIAPRTSDEIACQICESDIWHAEITSDR